MGLNARFLQQMIWLKSGGYLSSGQKVIEIGAQQLNNSFLKADTKSSPCPVCST